MNSEVVYIDKGVRTKWCKTVGGVKQGLRATTVFLRLACECSRLQVANDGLPSFFPCVTTHTHKDILRKPTDTGFQTMHCLLPFVSRKVSIAGIRDFQSEGRFVAPYSVLHNAALSGVRHICGNKHVQTCCFQVLPI